jgi:hypothetical protein
MDHSSVTKVGEISLLRLERWAADSIAGIHEPDPAMVHAHALFDLRIEPIVLLYRFHDPLRCSDIWPEAKCGGFGP